MRANLPSWWEKIRQHRVPIGVFAIILLAIIALIFAGYGFRWSWTGFQTKTLWDWLNLLGALAIPIVVGFGAAWFTSQQSKVSDRENTDNQRENALQSYIDKMSELLLHEKLRDSAEEDEARKIARVRTLTVLPRLDKERKRSVLGFLHESGLIDKDTSIINLRGANLSETNLIRDYLTQANLSGANLSNANLRDANLSGADLSNANLWGAELSGALLVDTNLFKANLGTANLSFACLVGANLDGANLTGVNLSMADLTKARLGMADLTGVDLSKANLNDADLSDAVLRQANITPLQLDKAQSLKNTIMPDGSEHP